MPDLLNAPVPVARPLRLGIHGSSGPAESILTRAGLPPSEVEFVQYDVRDPFGPLRDGQADAMLVKYTLHERDIAFSRAVELDARALIVGAGHPLAKRRTVSVEEAADYEAFEKPGTFPSYVWDLVVPRVTPGGRTIRRVHPMTTLEAMAAILADGRSVHLSFLSLAESLPAGTVAVPVHDLPPAPVSVAWLRDRPLPAATLRLIAAIELGGDR
ncbi:LysR family transcriptional regulator substrate-binding protein [Planotetraspora sp. A-T 1434]|uniref:LysR family transcriptional regulator substrate-binding protein n=1 Tax=Planotetraspora sp. A-T 1434 TaxID=2979219 RepID=UPI0021C1A143|nr:LysR family transcriptional regulator substrate-binding protein [Planotetraspora sp. A-T 1434]MCT9935142.1 LysR family transcriptional regulator substrate-binding protein [Planotetraspora sp. A-T 1434]